MQVYAVARNVVRAIVFSKDVLGSLLVVLFHFRCVIFPLIAEVFGQSAIAIMVGFLRLARMSAFPATRSDGKHTL